MTTSRSGDAFDLARLARAVESLIDHRDGLELQVAALHDELAVRDARIAALEAELATASARRGAAVERIDALVARLEQLDEMLDRTEEESGDSDAASPSRPTAGAMPS